MSRSYALLIGSLAAIWGASYLFIKVAVRDFPPAAMIELRLGVAGILLALFLVARIGWLFDEKWFFDTDLGNSGTGGVTTFADQCP